MRQPRKVGEKRRAKRDNIDSVYAGLAFDFGVYLPLSTIVDLLLSCVRIPLLTNIGVIGDTSRKQRQRFEPSRLIGINCVVLSVKHSVLPAAAGRNLYNV